MLYYLMGVSDAIPWLNDVCSPRLQLVKQTIYAGCEWYRLFLT